MQVAVAGVKDVGHAQLVLAGQGVDLAQDLRQARARDHAVLHVVGGGDPSHRGERRLARLPDQLALGLGLGDAHVEGPRLPADLDHPLEAVDALLARTVELDHQRRAGVEPVADMGGLLGGLDRQLVHHLDRARDDAGVDDRRHRVAGGAGVVEERHQRPDGLGRGDHPQRDPGGHAERALGADERAEQVIAGGVAVERHLRAVGEHDLERGHVVGREAVLEAVRPARVLGDVAADRADDLARGVGGIEMSGGDGARDRQVGHPGLDDDAGVVEVDRQDPAQPREDDQDAVGGGQRPARESRARRPGPPRARRPHGSSGPSAGPRRRSPGGPPPAASGDGAAARRTGRSRARADGSARARDRRSRAVVRSAPRASLTAASP